MFVPYQSYDVDDWSDSYPSSGEATSGEDDRVSGDGQLADASADARAAAVDYDTTGLPAAVVETMSVAQRVKRELQVRCVA